MLPSIIHNVILFIVAWMFRPKWMQNKISCRRRSMVGWYVSNTSIIFDCSMLLYYLFWMFIGFSLHFYIIFGTNLLTGGPARIAVFLPILVFRRKGISNGVQTEWNLRERSFWNKSQPGDLEWTSSNQRDGHEAGGTPTPLGKPYPLVGPS